MFHSFNLLFYQSTLVKTEKIRDISFKIVNFPNSFQSSTGKDAVRLYLPKYIKGHLLESHVVVFWLVFKERFLSWFGKTEGVSLLGFSKRFTIRLCHRDQNKAKNKCFQLGSNAWEMSSMVRYLRKTAQKAISFPLPACGIKPSICHLSLCDVLRFLCCQLLKLVLT